MKLSIVSIKDGKQNLIKYSIDEVHGGTGFEHVYFYKLTSHNKLIKYLGRDHYSNEAAVTDVEEIVTINNCYTNGKSISQSQYFSLTQAYKNPLRYIL